MRKDASVIRVRSRDALYQKLEVLKTNRNKRHRYGEFFVEGVRNLKEAIACGWEIVSFLYTPERQLSDWAQGILHTVAVRENIALTGELMDELSGKTDTSELMAVVRMRENDPSQLLQTDHTPLLALFDRPSNKGNLGTMLRSMDGLGIDGLILTGHGVDPYEPEVIGATMGSFFRVPFVEIARHDELSAFFGKIRAMHGDLQILGTTAHAEKPVWAADLTRPTVFMIGCETDGLSEGLRPFCTELLTIPMAKASCASSFNVSCAATVLFYEASRQRTAQ